MGKIFFCIAGFFCKTIIWVFYARIGSIKLGAEAVKHARLLYLAFMVHLRKHSEGHFNHNFQEANVARLKYVTYSNAVH